MSQIGRIGGKKSARRRRPSGDQQLEIGQEVKPTPEPVAEPERQDVPDGTN
jgi:hypothetical protein